MGTKISHLLPAPRKVWLNKEEDKYFEVNALNITQLTYLINNHREDLLMLMAISKSDKKDFSPFVSRAPQLVDDIICMSAGIDEQEEKDAFRLISGLVKVIALVEIWEATIPDPKMLNSLTDKVMSLAPNLKKPKEQSGNGNIVTLPQQNEA